MGYNNCVAVKKPYISNKNKKRDLNSLISTLNGQLPTGPKSSGQTNLPLRLGRSQRRFMFGVKMVSK
jgi:hypothetical protein